MKKLTIECIKGSEKTRDVFTVHKKFKKYVVLRNRKYRVCAFYRDIERGIPVVIY